MLSDPVALLWKRLEEEDCHPRGDEGNFYAICPSHRGKRRNLHINPGADGRALVFCNAGCSAEQVAAALGLRSFDLFPPGHYRGGRQLRPLPLARSEFPPDALEAANVIYGLSKLRMPWQLMIVCDCPSCGDPRGWFRASPTSIDFDCERGCDLDQFLQALRAQTADMRNPSVAHQAGPLERTTTTTSEDRALPTLPPGVI